ncbi:hypothetical protein SUDANB148_02308 [Streptomyces sp. SudanB148_2056]|uniref:hypothetical protein n=1 Tax=Streptomyces sp. SudanB148_2056 TaxID=3035280 RepID=UPI00363FCB6D
MTEEKSPWVGDQVYDADADREGVISDVKNGTYVLRAVDSWARTWTAPSAENLTLTVARLERLKKEREV